MEDNIQNYLASFDLDLRKSRNGRFMDQKVTPDVLAFIADCVINYVGDDVSRAFTVKDIWGSDYFVKNTKAIFNKPSPENPTVHSEYDKFIAQPLKTLAYAQVLHEEKVDGVNHYTIAHYPLLEYISLRERNAFNFLRLYLEKVLTDSGFIKYINDYSAKAHNGSLTDDDYAFLKEKYQQFIRGNTSINGNTEINRIFPKVLNVFAVAQGIPGSESGRKTEHAFNYSDLMYNRQNFRDINKPKGMSRQEAVTLLEESISADASEFNTYRIQKGMALIRKKYTTSEVHDQWSNGLATEVHHIFPQSTHPELAAHIENMIKLTSTQHHTKAHPNGNTSHVNRDYLIQCLLAKADSIQRSLSHNELIYSKESFVYVINKGIGWDLDAGLPLSEIKQALIKTLVA